MALNPPVKRKQPAESKNQSSDSKHAAKRVKTSRARSILTQASEKALNKNGDLDVSTFIKAREYEIKALESSMGSSKKSSSTRAFQQVPKDLRRRTASHNVKKVPKRLRARAAKEMKDDNTPTVSSRRRNPTPHMRLRLETAKRLETLSKRIQAKREKAFNAKHNLRGPHVAEKASATLRPPRASKNVLASPEKQSSKYRRREVHKSWLPTHIWHAKRARMPEPKFPLWRFAIPLSPTAKAHRPTHRAGSSRGCVAWDTSYQSTILVRGMQASLLGSLRALGIDEIVLGGKKGSRWRRGTRIWSGWIRERDGEQSPITEVQIIWCAEDTKLHDGAPAQKHKEKRQFILRVHPSAFLQVWTEVLKVAKIQKPSPDVEDLRFQIGSIDITGPGSTEALVGILKPKLQAGAVPSEKIARLWSQLGALTNPSVLPASAVLGLNFHDPRLFHPPRTVKSTNTEYSEHDFLTMLASWSPDTAASPSAIFSHAARYAASRLPSQKAINRRKGAALPGSYPLPLSTDPSIPILLIASRAPSLNMQGTWSLLIPWKCVLPVWHSLMHYPISSGGEPRFGGLQEKRQILFEQGQAWFPGDFQGTRAGWQWEVMEREKRKKAWEKRPKSKRISWDAVELGDGRKGEVGKGWACDWERLFEGPPPQESELISQNDSSKPPPAPAPQAAPTSSIPCPTASELPKVPTLPPKPPLNISHVSSALLGTLTSVPSRGLASVRLTLLHRGTPTVCARIYGLPVDAALRKKWLSLLSSLRSSVSPQTKSPHSKTARIGDSAVPSHVSDLPSDTPAHIKRQALARALLNGPVSANAEEYPSCPAEEDLIGFVTTGNFDLGMGRSAALGNIAIAKALKQIDVSENKESEATGESTGNEGQSLLRGLKPEDRICVVRNAGQRVARLARWEFV
ncbi:MAG: hypothetical protein Q9195_002658 [Heterodermia aff. obscurata]